MNANLLIGSLELPENCHNVIAETWDKATAAGFEQVAGFLDEEQLYHSIKWAAIAEADVELIIDTATAVKSNPDLLLLAKLAYWVLASSEEPELIAQFPLLQYLLPEQFGIFYLLIILQAVPRMVEKYREQGVDESIICDTLASIGGRCENHRIAYGVTGTLLQQLHWNVHYINGELYRLGRFEYKLIPMSNLIEVYRHRQHGQVMAVVKHSTTFDHDGFAVNNDNSESQTEVWHSVYEQNIELLTATLISPYGMALQEPITLDLTEWDLVIGKNHWMLDLHIPPGGKMSLDRCHESFNTAFSFFAEKFPDKNSSVIYCRSWIFNSQFEHALPQSNIAKLMREVYLFPVVRYNEAPGFFFVFCREYDHDLSQAPRKTKLQRAMLDILESDQSLRLGGMFMLKADMDKFGTNCYRNQTDNHG